MVPKLDHLLLLQQQVQQRVSPFPADLVLLLGGQEWSWKREPRQRQDLASPALAMDAVASAEQDGADTLLGSAISLPSTVRQLLGDHDSYFFSSF